MPPCPGCGRENPEWAQYCMGCGLRLKREPAPGECLDEANHIAYVLDQLPSWEARGWLNHAAAEELARAYAVRRTALLARGAGLPQPQTTAPAVDAPRVTPTAVVDWRVDREARIRAARLASAPPASAPPTPPGPPSPAVPVPPPAAAAAPPGTPPAPDRRVMTARKPPSQPRGEWVGEFLRVHWHQLLGVLAAVLIMVGMRQILQWEWVSTAAIALVPLLPIAITIGFHYLGGRPEYRGTIGAYVCRAIAILLASGCVYAVNKLWLGGALHGPYALLVCVAASTALAAWTVADSHDAGYLHLLLPGVGITLLAALRIVAPPASAALPSPAVYSSAFVGLAFLLVIWAWQCRNAEEPGELAAGAMAPLLIWAHLCVTFALGLAVLPILASQGVPLEAWALLAATAVLYGLAAQWFASENMAWAAGGLAAGAVGIVVWQHAAADWYAWGFGALVLCVGALGMSALSRKLPVSMESDRSPSVAYGQLGIVLAILAGGAVVGRVASAAIMTAPSIAGPDWPRGVVLAALCAAVYTALSVAGQKPVGLYAAAAGAAYALTLAAHCLLPRSGALLPHTLALDLLPFATLALFAGLGLRAYCEDERWERPWLNTALGSLIAGVAVAAVAGITKGSTAGVWLALLPSGALLATGATAMQAEEHGATGWAWAGATMASAMTCVALLAIAHTPAPPWSPALAAGVALACLGWIWYGLAATLKRLGSERLWLTPLYGGAAASALVGAFLSGCGADPAFGWLAGSFALSVGLLLTMAMAERSPEAACAAVLPLVLGCLRVYLAGLNGHQGAFVAAVALALAGSAAMGAASWCLSRSDLLWAGVGALGLAALCGFAPGSASVPLARYAADLSALGMAGGMVGLLYGAGWFRRGSFSATAALFGLAAYVRAISVITHLDPAWAGLAILPALAGLVIAARLLPREEESIFCVPLQAVTVAAACAALVVPSAAALGWHRPDIYPAALTLLCYAPLFGGAALAGRKGSQGLGGLSAASLLGGWGFTAALAGGSAEANVALVLAVVASGACAVLWGLTAYAVEEPGFGYAAGLAACGAAAAFLAGVAREQWAWWPLAALPFLAAMYLAGHRMAGEHDEFLTGPLRHVALAAGCTLAVLTAIAALEYGTSALTAALTLSAYAPALLAAAQARRENGVGLALATCLALLGAFSFALAAPAETQASTISLGAAGAALALCAALYARLAGLCEEEGFGVLSGAAAVAVGVVGLLLGAREHPLWWPGVLLPYLVALFAGSRLFARTGGDKTFATPFRATVTVVSALSVVWAVAQGLQHPAATSWAVTGTIAAYAAVYLVAACLLQTRTWAGLFVGAASLAFGYRLGTMGLTPPQWGFGFACAGLVWLAVARALEAAPSREPLPGPFYAAAPSVAGVGALVALAYVTMPNQGMFTLLALAVAGTVCLGLTLVERGAAFVHAGIGCYLLAYALYLYDRFNIGVGVLDLYLIPVGVYLLVLGHAASGRKSDDSAAALWWLGLLVTLTPTFVSFYDHYTRQEPPLHAALLLLECGVAIGWGIAHRIRAFVFAGALFLLAFAAVLGASAVHEIWSGVFAVVLGVALAGFVFYVSTHQDEIREWLARAGAGWQEWR